MNHFHTMWATEGTNTLFVVDYVDHYNIVVLLKRLGVNKWKADICGCCTLGWIVHSSGSSCLLSPKCMGWGELWGTGSGTWQWGHKYRVGLSQEEMCLKNRAKPLLIDRLKNLEGFIYLEVSMKPLIVIRLESNMEVKVHL